MHGIYKSGCTSKFYKKMKAGEGRYRGMFLWQPMIKIGPFYVKDRRSEPFWLDDYDFEFIKYPFSIHRSVFEMPAKIRLMHEHNYYKTMSGDWRDSHMVRYVPKERFQQLSLEELKKEL